MRYLIQNGRVIDPANSVDAVLDMRIENGRVAEIGEKLLLCGEEIINAEGLIVAPGFVDMHTHLREPGYEYKETIQSGAQAAIAGGFTAVACMANTKPVADNASVIEYIRQKAREAGAAKVYPIGAATKGLEGKELSEMADMKRAGIVAISDDGRPVMNGQMMRLVMTYAKMFDLAVLDHCEDLELVNDGVMNEGYHSTILGLRGATRAAEEAQIARDIQLAGITGARLHLCHVSTAGGVALVRRGKADGIKVTCETAPHYLAGDDALVMDYSGNARVNPPLRTPEDTAALFEGLCDGTIDAIATDHAPHHRDEKEVEFNLASSGISGLETALALCLTSAVIPGHVGLSRLIECMSTTPARLLGVAGGKLSKGDMADIAVFDPAAKWVIRPENFLSKGKNTPFAGREVTGKVLYTFVDGKLLWNRGALV